ncbi:hypothetical protein CK203_063639 [Vitis vinifera]|uniref:Uncharacterized protein n=1 Tax=Vitis vinifera TaxID=29760 RepID=A0A438G4T2_VITVI|nr:hypothetical protein CK203_063639 [Vitis vinifera]
MWAMAGCCDNVQDLLTSVNDPEKHIGIVYVGHLGALWQWSGCYVCKCRVPLLEGVRIGEARHMYSWGNPDEINLDENVCHVSLRDVCHVSSGDVCHVWGGGPYNAPLFNLPILPEQNGRVTAFAVFNPILPSLHSVRTFVLVFSLLRFVLLVVSGLLGQGFSLGRVKGLGWVCWLLGFSEIFCCLATSSGPSGDAYAEKSANKLSVKEFRERFCIPNGVSVELTDGEAVSTEKGEDHAICFSKEQFNAGLPVSPTVFVQGVSALHPDSSGLCRLPSVPAVGDQPTGLDQGGRQGHVLVKGVWAGLAMHPNRPFAPNQSLKVLGPEKRGKLVEWLEKASFDRLNRLFEIAAVEQSCDTLLSVQNLRSVVAGEHFVLQDLPLYAAVQKADARTRKARLNNQEIKRKEGLLRKARVANGPRPLHLLEVTIREPEHPIPPSISSGPGHLAGLNHSGPSMSVAGHLALLAEEATSINQLGSPHSDGDAAEAFCAAALPPTASPMEKWGQRVRVCLLAGPSPLALVPVKGPARRRSRLTRDLKSGLIGGFRIGFLETIEVSCSFVQDDHPEESEAEMAVDNRTCPSGGPEWGFTRSDPAGRD